MCKTEVLPAKRKKPRHQKKKSKVQKYEVDYESSSDSGVQSSEDNMDFGVGTRP